MTDFGRESSPLPRRAGGSAAVRIGLGIVVGQALIYLTLPLITRLYSPVEMGQAGVFLAAAAIIGVVSTSRFETRLPSADSTQARWLTLQARRSIIAWSVIAALIFAAVSDQGWALAVVFGLAVAGLGFTYLTLQSSARLENLSGVPLAKVGQGASQVTAQITLGAAGFGRVGMQLGYALGYATTAVIQALAIRRTSFPVEATTSTPSAPWRRAALTTAVTLTIAAGFNASAVWMNPLVVSALFDDAEAGQLTLAMRVVVIPVSLVIASLTPVILATVGRRVREGADPLASAKRYLMFVVPLGALTLGLPWVVPETAVTSLLGEDWARSRDYLQMLSPAVAFQLVVGPLSGLLIVLGFHRAQLMWDALRAVALLAVMIAAALSTRDPLATVLMGSVVLVIFYVVYCVLLLLGCRKVRDRPADEPVSPHERFPS